MHFFDRRRKYAKYNVVFNENWIDPSICLKHINTNKYIQNVSDKRNDLAILQTISLEMASADTKSFVQSLAIQIVPIIQSWKLELEYMIVFSPITTFGPILQFD